MQPGDSFEPHRAYLVRLAYRMLGDVSAAEDMAQESFLRWQRSGTPTLEKPRAWFTRTCTRLCLDHLELAHRQREEYVGEWLPEPLLADDKDAPAEVDESLSLALLTTIQKLKPAERAAFLLHDVFDYEFSDVAEILDLEPANCRQLAVRARRHLKQDPLRAPADKETVSRLSTAFFDAIADGNLAGLQKVLSEDVVFRSDGGGKVSAARQPLIGTYRVLRFIDRVFISAKAPASVERRPAWFNGAPGILLFEEGVLSSAFQLRVEAGRITTIFVQRNPDKLARLRPTESH